jgi:hypothetical protein
MPAHHGRVEGERERLAVYLDRFVEESCGGEQHSARGYGGQVQANAREEVPGPVQAAQKVSPFVHRRGLLVQLVRFRLAVVVQLQRDWWRECQPSELSWEGQSAFFNIDAAQRHRRVDDRRLELSRRALGRLLRQTLLELRFFRLALLRRGRRLLRGDMAVQVLFWFGCFSFSRFALSLLGLGGAVCES